MTATFLMLGFAFWEASGGAEFATPATASTAVPLIAQSREAVPGAFEDRLAGVAALAEMTDEAPRLAARPVVDALPVEIVARAATDFAVPAAPEPLARREVTGNRVNLREGPNTSFAVVETLAQGTVTEVMEDAGTWSRLRLEDGRTGWMANNFLRDV